MQESAKQKILIAIGLGGLLVAALAGMAEHVPWLQALCLGLSGGCKETADFTIFKIPVWAWGVFYFTLLLGFILRAREWVPLVASSAVGVELALIWIMISHEILCVFCLANLVVVLLLFAFSFKKERFWQELSVSLLALLFALVTIPHENELQASTGKKREEPAIVARIGQEIITQEQLEEPLLPRLHDMEMEAYRLKRQRLDQMIADNIFLKEAGHKGVTLEQFVNETVLAEVNVTDEEVERYYQENRSRITDWKGTEEELKTRIRASMQQQKNIAKVMEYAKALEPKYGVSVYLREPPPPDLKVDVAGSPSVGPPDAAVKIVEFSDYQCPACRQAHDVVKQVRQAYSGKVLWIFKDLPLKMHKDAQRAAEAARCAADQNKFWEYQDVLYASRDELSVDRLVDFASQMKLDAGRFRQCLESGQHKPRVEKDMEDARRAGVDRTPTFLINGKLSTGAPPFERFKEIIDGELSKAKGKS